MKNIISLFIKLIAHQNVWFLFVWKVDIISLTPKTCEICKKNIKKKQIVTGKLQAGRLLKYNC